MQQTKLTRKTVVAISTAFALALLGAFWWKLNPRGAQTRERYYLDAAKLQAEEAHLPVTDKDPPQPSNQPRSDEAYQPERGHIQ